MSTYHGGTTPYPEWEKRQNALKARTRPIGSKATLKGKPVQWAGRDYEWQSPESFKKLDDAEYFAPTEKLARTGLKVLDKLSPVGEFIGQVGKGFYGAANSFLPQGALQKQIMINTAEAIAAVPEGIGYGADKLTPQGTVGPSTALLIGALGNEALERAIPALNFTNIPGLNKNKAKLLAGLEQSVTDVPTSRLAAVLEKQRLAKTALEGGGTSRSIKSIIQMDIDSPLLHELANVNTAADIHRIQTNYFNRHPQHLRGGLGNELDHTAAVSRVGDVLAGQKPGNIDTALRALREEYGIKFADDGDMSSLPFFAHAYKHSGNPTVIDWSTPWANEMINKVPKNATAKELKASLLELYEKSLVMTGRAVQTQDFHNFRHMLMDALPSNVRDQLGKNFDITGRTASKADWDLFRLSLKESPMKPLIRQTGQTMPEEVIRENSLLNTLGQ